MSKDFNRLYGKVDVSTPEKLYAELHKIDAIAAFEKLDGIWYIENSIDERRSRMTACFKTLLDACKGLWVCADWYRETGTGTICFKEFGLNSRNAEFYSADTKGVFGYLWV